MVKTVVLYKSRYGSTKKYAQWISNEIGANVFENSEVKIEDLIKYDTIIFGGGLYTSGINGIDIIIKNYQALQNKNIIVFTVGLTPTDDYEILKPIIEKNFSDNLRENIHFFHLRGGIDFKKLNSTHKFMMSMLKKLMAKKKPEKLPKSAKMILEAHGENIDFTDIRTIEPIILYVKGL